jgi:uncharacterized protein YegP (UPF0339 family)
MKFQIYKSGNEWRFRLIARNGKIVATGESYRRRKAVYKTINRIIEAIQITGFEIVEQGE